MKLIFLSVLLFGLVHPGAKWMLRGGVGLLPFCLLYVGIRLAVQVPIALRRRVFRLGSLSRWIFLMSLGAVGTALQLTEFVGISRGIPVSTVTFLVYTHPIWTLLFSKLINHEPLTKSGIGRILMALAGVALLASPRSGLGSPLILFGPLAAAVFISLWVCLSSRARREGCSAFAVSFFYDLFAFAGLLALQLAIGKSGEIASTFTWLLKGDHLLRMAVYSIGIGLLPNYLFYFGCPQTSALSAGLLLLLEPVIASLVSIYAWNDRISPGLVFGAATLLLAALPTSIARAAYRKIRFLAGPAPSSSRPTCQNTLAVALALACFCSFRSLAYGKRAPVSSARALHVVEIVPTASPDYTVSSELNEIGAAVDLGAKAYRRYDAGCKFRVDKTLGIGSEGDLISKIRSVASQDGASIAIGFSRSNFARTAAKAAAGKALVGISIGAATTQLSAINPRFVSLASPWTKQWTAIREHMSGQGCKPGSTLGIFDVNDHLSATFRTAFSNAGFHGLRDVHDVHSDRILDRVFKCVFVGVSFPTAQPLLKRIAASRWKGNIYGVGDWNIYAAEIRKFLPPLGRRSLSVWGPTGWLVSLNARSKAFAAQMRAKLGADPSPIAAYAFDATLIGLSALCRGTDPRRFKPAERRHLPVLREYAGVSPTGNYLSRMHLVQFKNLKSPNQGGSHGL